MDAYLIFGSQTEPETYQKLDIQNLVCLLKVNKRATRYYDFGSRAFFNRGIDFLLIIGYNTIENDFGQR